MLLSRKRKLNLDNTTDETTLLHHVWPNAWQSFMGSVFEFARPEDVWMWRELDDTILNRQQTLQWENAVNRRLSEIVWKHLLMSRPNDPDKEILPIDEDTCQQRFYHHLKTNHALIAGGFVLSCWQTLNGKPPMQFHDIDIFLPVPSVVEQKWTLMDGSFIIEHCNSSDLDKTRDMLSSASLLYLLKPWFQESLEAQQQHGGQVNLTHHELYTNSTFSIIRKQLLCIGSMHSNRQVILSPLQEHIESFATNCLASFDMDFCRIGVMAHPDKPQQFKLMVDRAHWLHVREYISAWPYQHAQQPYLPTLLARIEKYQSRNCYIERPSMDWMRKTVESNKYKKNNCRQIQISQQ